MRLRSPYDRQILRVCDPRPRGARSRAALRPRRHRCRRSPRALAARRARSRRNRALRPRDVQLPPVRHDGAGRPGHRSRRGSDRGEARGTVSLRSRSRSDAASPSRSRCSRAGSSIFSAPSGATADYAVTYLQIAALGIPSAFLAIGGQGFLRGVSDLRTPLVIVIAGNVVNLILRWRWSTASISGSRGLHGERWPRRQAWGSRWSSRSCAGSVSPTPASGPC